MKRPSMDGLPESLARALRGFARSVAPRERCWLVGGAVRDLALGREVHDLDIASALRPAALETIFPRALAVGRAFGTLLVTVDDVQIQHTTFRSEGSYRDARRPDAVLYGESLEEDAERRDFTCNALYLDPLNDELRDPTAGLADLEHGRLRCVGDPAQRFAEDGLRLIRLARFAAAYGLAVEPATLAGARSAVDTLRGVSPERLYGELARMAQRPGAVRGIRLLEEIGVLAALLTRVGGAGGATAVARLGELDRGDAGVDLVDILGALFEPGAADSEAAVRALAALRVPRAVARDVAEVWTLRDDADRIARDAGATRAERVRLIRAPAFARALRWLRVGAGVGSAGTDQPDRIDTLEHFAARLTPAERQPDPWLVSADLVAAGIPRGPSFGAVLREAEDRQLEGELGSRAAALAWLAERAAERGAH